MRLQIDMAGLDPATRAPCDLHDLLKAAFRRAQIPTLQAQVCIHHANQCQIGEVIAFGDKLGTNDNINIACLHPADKFSGLGRRPQRVRGDNGPPRLGKENADFI